MPNPNSSKRFCFTLYKEVKEEKTVTYTLERAEEVFESLHEQKVINYTCYQQEQGCEEGKHHLQGYLELAGKGSKGFKTKSKVASFLRGYLPEGDAYAIFFRYMNFAIAKGSAEQNKAYCSKETCECENDVCNFGHGHFNEIGEVSQQGRRTDVYDVKDAIDGGMSYAHT